MRKKVLLFLGMQSFPLAPLLLLGACLFFSSLFRESAFAQNFPSPPGEENFFVDQAGFLDSSTADEINGIASQLLHEQDIPIIVATIPSLSALDAPFMTIEQYARELFDHWGIGSKERNYGMLLLVSEGDRRARIELGADWGYTQDSQAQYIMDELIVPQFKAGNYSGGILAGVRGLDALARKEALPKPKAPWWQLPLTLLLIVLVIGVIVSLFKSGRSGWGWALIVALGALLFFLLRASARGGSSGAFGGGFSGGGGASGSW